MRMALRRSTPSRGMDTKSPSAGLSKLGIGMRTPVTTRVWTRLTPGSAAMRAARLSGARSAVANTSPMRCAV